MCASATKVAGRDANPEGTDRAGPAGRRAEGKRDLLPSVSLPGGDDEEEEIAVSVRANWRRGSGAAEADRHVCLPTRLLAAGGKNCNSSFFFPNIRCSLVVS